MSEPSTPSTALSNQLNSENFDWWASVGGVRGMIESVLPLTVFLAAYTLTNDVRIPAMSAGALTVLFILIRLITRAPVSPAVSGGIITAISVAATLWTGRGENYFAFGLITTGIVTTALLVSVVLRQPAAAHAVAMVWNLPRGWMADTDYDQLRGRCTVVTILWATMMLIRLAVQVPLWYAGQVEALATAKLVMGLPLLAVVVWMSWMLLRPFNALQRTN